jgi:hypothetical protein
MKQILIEKYINPSEVIFDFDNKLFGECWTNEYGEFHSILNQPAEIWYFPNGNIDVKAWWKKGHLYRRKGLCYMICYNENGKETKRIKL